MIAEMRIGCPPYYKDESLGLDADGGLTQSAKAAPTTAILRSALVPMAAVWRRFQAEAFRRESPCCRIPTEHRPRRFERSMFRGV